MTFINLFFIISLLFSYSSHIPNAFIIYSFIYSFRGRGKNSLAKGIFSSEFLSQGYFFGLN